MIMLVSKVAEVNLSVLFDIAGSNRYQICLDYSRLVHLYFPTLITHKWILMLSNLTNWLSSSNTAKFKLLCNFFLSFLLVMYSLTEEIN